MDGKLYVFGIGGTGSRVLKSLVMLAAAGVKIDAKAIVPIIIDPDFANADVTRTIEQIKTYNKIRETLNFNDAVENGFFKTEFKTLSDSGKEYRLSIDDTKSRKFNEFIEFSTLSKENQALASMLFSDDNLDSDMEVGFRGNPNVGSVVLNQFTDSQDFVDFASSFQNGDRIFIISSIFGGTGASGFPLLLKTLRGLDGYTQNHESIKKAPIGAVSVLPYFNVEPKDDSKINSATFIGKAKAALQYYEKNVNGDGSSSINVLYYIGDVATNKYENIDGGQYQKNNAHFIELASALAIVDFANTPKDDETLQCSEIEKEEGKKKIYAPNPAVKEFGILEDKEEILFNNLSDDTKDIICAPMTRFVLFSKYVKEHLKEGTEKDWAKDIKCDSTFTKSSFVRNVTKITDSYIEWLKEMSENPRKFKPFELSVTGSDIFSIVLGAKASPIIKYWNKSGYDLIDAALNGKRKSLSNDLSIEKKFIELFYITTKDLVELKYKF